MNNRSSFGNGCVLKHQIVEYQGYDCFIPSIGFCFVKCNKF